MTNKIYLVTYPDFKDGKITIVLHNLSKEVKEILMPMLFDKLPEDSVIVLGDNIEWAKKFNNAYWIVEDQNLDFVNSERQFKISDVNSIAEYCAKLFFKINNIT
jgi:hypothetical protein